MIVAHCRRTISFISSSNIYIFSVYCARWGIRVRTVNQLEITQNEDVKEFVELIVPHVFHESILLSITKGKEKGWKKALMENTRDYKFQHSIVHGIFLYSAGIIFKEERWRTMIHPDCVWRNSISAHFLSIHQIKAHSAIIWWIDKNICTIYHPDRALFYHVFSAPSSYRYIPSPAWGCCRDHMMNQGTSTSYVWV